MQSIPFSNSGFTLCDISDFATGLSVFAMRLLRQFLQLPVHFWIQKQLLFRIPKLNGTVVVVGHNLHKINQIDF